MAYLLKQKYKFWTLGIAVAMIFVFISGIFKTPDPKDLTTITVNAPENMQVAFENTLKKLKVNDEYALEFTNDQNANFVVTAGAGAKGELLAYSPFVAVFNTDDDLYARLVDEEIFVTSDIDSTFCDFDFKKVIEQILSSSGSDTKVYYPAKDSEYWDEFYSFLLFTVNDGYYPKPGTDMQQAEKKIEDFLNSKNAEPISNASLKRINSIPQNSIYFMTYVDLASIYKTSGISQFIIMYPKTVVYHSYYASFDETGKILFDLLDDTYDSFWERIDYVGYYMLKNVYYNTRYTSTVYRFTDSRYNDIMKRDQYNGVEIPELSTNDLNKEEK